MSTIKKLTRLVIKESPYEIRKFAFGTQFEYFETNVGRKISKKLMTKIGQFWITAEIGQFVAIFSSIFSIL